MVLTVENCSGKTYKSNFLILILIYLARLFAYNSQVGFPHYKFIYDNFVYTIQLQNRKSLFFNIVTIWFVVGKIGIKLKLYFGLFIHFYLNLVASCLS